MPVYEEATMKSKTVVCVGGLVRKRNTLLAVRQAGGHSLEGQWTVPWGRLEDGESPSLAVLREVKEEGGIVASIDGLLGAQELPAPWSGWLALIYLCSYETGEAKPDGVETDAAEFLTLDDLESLDEPIEPWSEWIMRRVLRNDYTLTTKCPENPFRPAIGFL